jgi:hypothetical protein
LLFSTVAVSVSGQSLTDFISAEQARALLAGETPVETQFKDPQPQLLPRHAGLKRRVDALRAELDPGIMVETLHIYEKPREAQKTAWSAAEEARLYNSVLALSTLAGPQYFSASRGVMRTFYETSSVIDNPTAKKTLPDPVYTRPPAELTIYARQKDSTFGDNIYQYDFYTADGIMIFVQQNLTALTAGIIPAVGKNKLRSVVAVLDAGEYILIYAASMAKTVALPGMKERMGDSFANRAEAVLLWFKDQADKAFSKR